MTPAALNPQIAPTKPMPGNVWLDSTWAVLRDGYDFIHRRCSHLRSDLFRTRLLFQPTICLHGEAGARLFYDSGRFMRRSAAPLRLRRTLLGQRTVQSLDDEAHRERKALLLAQLTPEKVEAIAVASAEEWRRAATSWPARKIVLFDAAGEVLTRAACRWAGVMLSENEVAARAADIRAVIEGSGGVGPRHWRGLAARRRCNQWMTSAIAAVRACQVAAPADSALVAIASYRDSAGNLLPEQVAGEELFNLIRPSVAVDRFITFAALAYHDYPHERSFVTAGNNSDLECFAQEVRRFYPFFPFAVARVRETFVWKEYLFPAGVRVLLDLYGTDHDPRLWDRPEEFLPARFRNARPNAFCFIPQGGGDVARGHRCPGEAVTVALMKVALRFLVHEVIYSVPQQDLTVDHRRMPALPKSGFVIHCMT